MTKRKRGLPPSKKEPRKVVNYTAKRCLDGLMLRIPQMSKADALLLRNDLFELVLKYNISLVPEYEPEE
jgi:hypothetical protein